MFVKKDLRKIPQIFEEANENQGEPLYELRLARRAAEFNGSIDVLCRPLYSNSIHNLVSLSLYDCQISSIQGIEFFQHSNLKELNLGRNPIREIPKSFSSLQTLERLWLDDCQLSGPIPEEILSLQNLLELRISNNALSSIQPDDISDDTGIKLLSNLKVLCLDGNKIEKIPNDLVHLTQLQSLLLRKNQINDLPEGVPGPSHAELTLFHISSNKLRRLPMSLVKCPALERIYANGNEISDLPSLELILTLKYCNLSNNKIANISSAFTERFGNPEQDGKFTKDCNCSIILEQNPFLKTLKDQDTKEDEAMEVDLNQ